MQNNEIIKPAKYFSELEKSILLALVEKYKYVLECKKSDARTIALKQRTWQALAHEYNSQPSVSLRDFKQLKKCWENIKARTKKIMAHERREKVKRSVSPLLSTHVLGKEKITSMLPEQLYFLQSPPEEEPEYHPDNAAQGHIWRSVENRGALSVGKCVQSNLLTLVDKNHLLFQIENCAMMRKSSYIFQCVKGPLNLNPRVQLSESQPINTTGAKPLRKVL
ncbi:myb/SANT-like DNA-binding domain-containing protein 3 isoform X2 [Canis lupus baileyi]|uniref:myb/SANT-like DNA-binding domain-containing protein 3 isoform X2 n=1 Tax=Canis lupus familiaris TaxID=9615 RepID=UPI000DC67B1F|nr:myb/SANT-like DNA-binding domain-containing protein 3 isoform X2 [Canis lupus familiaris]XP_038514148.1 myb/SANT-like DNA-binding domain-containing protein 3 isoform X2 [Canis lupus familiaris]XP_038538214.1 myb/SANT-like DNA-binding domain-containing protein 3 isoform X2 [Canis lupus familiaris]XP_048972269.1 myb/SANT-like DNA-binding domain-containing protein 3 isoform X2 [Canis lupus dingo]